MYKIILNGEELPEEFDTYDDAEEAVQDILDECGSDDVDTFFEGIGGFYPVEKDEEADWDIIEE